VERRRESDIIEEEKRKMGIRLISLGVNDVDVDVLVLDDDELEREKKRPSTIVK